jgi:hypothetical protein
MARLAAHMLVSLLIRRVSAAGGFATVLHMGDRDAGAILIQCLEKGQDSVILEPRSTLNGGREWVATGPDAKSDAAEQAQYFGRRIHNDPDIWILELDIAMAAQFAVDCLNET